MSQITGLSSSLMGTMITYAQVENSIVVSCVFLFARCSPNDELTFLRVSQLQSLERIQEFALLPSEDPNPSSYESEKSKDRSWPSKGALEFQGVSIRYREELDLALDSVSFSLEGGKKIGICGRFVSLLRCSLRPALTLASLTSRQNWIGQIFDPPRPLPSHRPRFDERTDLDRRHRHLDAPSSSASRLNEVSSSSPYVLVFELGTDLPLFLLALPQHRHSRSVPRRHPLCSRQPRPGRPLLGRRDMGSSPLCRYG